MHPSLCRGIWTRISRQAWCLHISVLMCSGEKSNNRERRRSSLSNHWTFYGETSKAEEGHSRQVPPCGIPFILFVWPCLCLYICVCMNAAWCLGLLHHVRLHADIQKDQCPPKREDIVYSWTSTKWLELWLNISEFFLLLFLCSRYYRVEAIAQLIITH